MGSSKGGTPAMPEMGFTVFSVWGGNFIPSPNNGSPPLPPNPYASWKFQTVGNHGIGSKVAVANHPGGAGGQGVILSVSNAGNIYTYLFFQQPTFSSAFRISCPNGVLEDMECAGEGAGGQLPPQIAWVGNKMGTAEQPQRTAYYLHMNLPSSQPPPPYPFPTTTAMFTYFHPFPAGDNAYYALHKLYFYRQPGDLLFHAGGYYQHHNGNKTTFAVTPDFTNPDDDDTPCVTREYVMTSILGSPSLQPLDLHGGEIDVVVYEVLSKKYNFCEIDCEGELQEEGEECGNVIIEGK
ncbi:MAG: hypothetical protein FWH36_02100 [Lentimicrobiaceae bacterium]|nr:hypothetical protein [Lentimicrobiaceae bacterium]